MSVQQKMVVIGMSGGVDSSVAAYLLKQSGYKVVGLFMKNWEETQDQSACSAEQDYKDVISVCEKLEIPYYSVNFAAEYRNQVFHQFLEDTKNGLTPNPDVLCNREIKFKVFYDFARKLGADFVATGHYAQLVQGKLHKGADEKKDQTYFLAAVDPSVFEHVLFPIGHLPKKEVREIAEKIGLVTADKKDSTGICFIGERPFKDFVSHYVKSQKGDFINEKGEIIGLHDGACFYTIGQRKGLGIGGPGEAWFVAGKNQDKNQVILVQGEHHPLLYKQALKASKPHWLTSVSLPRILSCKIRYRQKDQECWVNLEDDGLTVIFKEPQRAITPGQFIVFYDQDECLGSAEIQYGFDLSAEAPLPWEVLASYPSHSPDPAAFTI
jgi:tRNA-uridine 2-sulfurtransferase